MSDNEWPFGGRRDPADRPDPAEQSGDASAGPGEETRADEQGWGWVEDEEPAQEGAQQEAQAQPAARPTRRARFRRWRHSRPFWGAVLVLLGGFVIAVPPLMAYKIILVAPSVGIATGVGWVVVILGIVSLMTPSQNKLYGLLAILMGGIAVVSSNLGGFLLGTILTVLGGALTFAWTELPPEEQPERLEGLRRSPQQETAELGDRTEPAEDHDAGPEDEAGSRDDGGEPDQGRPRDEEAVERTWIETR